MNTTLVIAGLAALAGPVLLTSCDRLKKPARPVGATPAPQETTGTPPAAAVGRPEIRSLSAADYDSFVAVPGRVAIIDFYADWCGPCRMLGPILEKVTAEFGGRVALGKVNVDQQRELAAAHGARSIPDVRIHVDGKMVDKFVGALPESAVRELIRRQVAQLPAAAATPPPASPEKPAVPARPPIQPMDKDWLPPGVERR